MSRFTRPAGGLPVRRVDAINFFVALADYNVGEDRPHARATGSTSPPPSWPQEWSAGARLPGTLRGIKDSPPYLHDGRLPTLADTIKFFNVVLGLKLEPSEKEALVAYMLAL